jgi:hypothetical protein
LVSFAGAVVIGLAMGHSAVVILSRAMVVMLLSWVAGRLIGGLAQHQVEQAINQYKEAHPIPEVFDESALEDEEVIEAVPLSEADQMPGRSLDSQMGAMPGSRMAVGAGSRTQSGDAHL